jgi:hypothetical protein
MPVLVGIQPPFWTPGKAVSVRAGFRENGGRSVANHSMAVAGK